MQVIARIEQQAAWALKELEEKKKQKEQADAERIAFAQIDWHDFTVVATIEFTDADTGDVNSKIMDVTQVSISASSMQLVVLAFVN